MDADYFDAHKTFSDCDNNDDILPIMMGSAWFNSQHNGVLIEHHPILTFQIWVGLFIEGAKNSQIA